MPSISTTISNSLLIPRQITEQLQNVNDHVSNVKDSLSSWDKCISHTYCELPAIIGIVVGLLVFLSIVICLTRCLCCGYSCCCSCFSFLSCCACSRGCCDGKKNKSTRYMDQNSTNLGNQGYVAPGAMMAGGINTPQYAQFPTSTANKPVNEDALPAMPSWDTATKVHVLDEDEDEKNVDSKDTNSLKGQQVPLITAAAATGMSSSNQKSQDPLLHQPQPISGIKSRFTSPGDPFQNRIYQDSGTIHSRIPSSETESRVNTIRYGGSSTHLVRDDLRPIQNSNNQNSPATYQFAPNQFGPPGPGYVTPTPVPNQFGSPGPGPATPTFAPNRFGSPGPGKIMPGRAYQPPPDQGPMMNYQGYRG